MKYKVGDILQFNNGLWNNSIILITKIGAGETIYYYKVLTNFSSLHRKGFESMDTCHYIDTNSNLISNGKIGRILYG